MLIESVIAATVVAEAEVESGNADVHASPWVYGGTGFVVFLLLLFLVTRMNIDR
jgi:hypothetical protein